MANIEQKIEDLIKKEIEDLEYELYDVQYVKEGKDYYLKIFIDNKKGISLEDCEKASNKISEIIDSVDYMQDQYYLEVSSPGVERILRKEKHIQDNVGKLIEVKLFKLVDNKKEYIGILKNNYKDEIILNEEKEIKLNKKDIAQIKIKYEW